MSGILKYKLIKDILMDLRKQTYLSFHLGDEVFAIRVDKVLEVLEMPKITKVPKAQKYIRGVVNFRGEILPVVDTRIKFNMIELEEKLNMVVIVLDLVYREKSVILGAIADSVKDVIEINSNDIKSIPEMGSRYNAEYVSGMWKNDEGFIMILDVDKVFSIEELSVKELSDIETDFF